MIVGWDAEKKLPPGAQIVEWDGETRLPPGTIIVGWDEEQKLPPGYEIVPFKGTIYNLNAVYSLIMTSNQLNSFGFVPGERGASSAAKITPFGTISLIIFTFCLWHKM